MPFSTNNIVQTQKQGQRRTKYPTVKQSYFGFKILNPEDETLQSTSWDPIFVRPMATKGVSTDHLQKLDFRL